jgi:uncharacterized protein (TIGR00375 family)
MKGLDILGTGDFTHPEWLTELQADLIQEPDGGLFKPSNRLSTFFILTTEVCTVFNFKGESKKIHHLLLTPDFETAQQINDRLNHYGSLTIDGRPTLGMTAPQLVEEVMAISSLNEVIPAHVWTPWFSLFGAQSGFDTIEDCYQDSVRHIHSLETGLSSDPLMNWKISALDKYTLVSNSDSHSAWPWRIGREANVFKLKHPSYVDIIEILRTKDQTRFLFTIETNPAYGKYHWSGHRNCDVSLPPQVALEAGGICPVCRRKLTKGVDQRIEELSDRSAGFEPTNAIGYLHLLPLSEILATVLGTSSPNVKSVWAEYNNLTSKCGNEYTVLIDTPFDELVEITKPAVAEAIIRVRDSRVVVTPGYDGVYGQLDLTKEALREGPPAPRTPQPGLNKWC